MEDFSEISFNIKSMSLGLINIHTQPRIRAFFFWLVHFTLQWVEIKGDSPLLLPDHKREGKKRPFGLEGGWPVNASHDLS